MNRVCVYKITGKLLEMQSGGDDRPDLMDMRLDTLRQNGINAGYKEDEIDVKWVTDAELAELTAPTAEDMAAQEALAIKAKLADIDIKSIRSIREWVAKQSDAPQYAKDFEIMASTERAKLK